MDKSPLLRVAMLYPDRSPRIGFMENTVEAFQNAVDGLILLCWPNNETLPALFGTVLICSRSGLIGHFNGNSTAFGLVIGGNAIVCSEVEAHGTIRFADISDGAVEWMLRRFPDIEITVELFHFSSA